MKYVDGQMNRQKKQCLVYICMDGRVYANQVFEDLALQYEGFEINKINIVLHELS